MKEPEVNLQLALEHGLSEEEFNKILKILGRTPTYTELGVFSVMWSEHCSYKNSLVMLRTLPREGEALLVKAGEENAGLVDIGDGLAVAFKIESHNHPSAVEPYQGAATGVGGIMRDIFAMGARPIAALDSLRFGPLSDNRVRYLFDGVVRGIGDYGNCLGIPTVAGDVYFEKSYRGNPLVNAMTVGIVRTDRLAHAVARGEGNPVFVIGSSTGRDGIHGATFASEEITEESEERRPQVQVGDPFTEKLIMEATLELIESGCVVGVQDMGAAGITSSASETAAKGGVGMELDLDKVPLREKGMIPYEIMLSESQERMLIIAKKGREEDVRRICDKWDLNCAEFGRVTSDGMLRVKWHGQVVVEIPAQSLAAGEGAPVYTREAEKPDYIDKLRNYDFNKLPQPEDCNLVLLSLLGSPNIASKAWVFEQYDTMVQTNTVVLPGGDAAVLRIKGTNKALAMKTDCNSCYVYLNPRRGAQIAVAEAARNVACTGAKPVAITNCLNFGNPYKPDNYWQFQEAVLGMGEACRQLNTPVTGGNVSFYNENPDGAIYPTPVIGMIGIMDDVHLHTTTWFKSPGDWIVLLGRNKGEVGGSEYIKMVHDLIAGDAPSLDLKFEKRLQQFLLQAIHNGWIKSAHDTAEGGLAVALAECCFLDHEHWVGAEIKLGENMRSDFLLFAEDQSRIVVSVAAEDLTHLQQLAKKQEIPLLVLGKVTNNARLRIHHRDKLVIDLPIVQMADVYFSAIQNAMEIY
ncbi:phosphoribosylformylglycinamidine synthase subunit PurL [candidate division KSB1 bacterium]|nr:MAG: phosphoribosylformylglycinamidine synthase subunit PurL [candidate division KSB1 bacterium]